MGVPNGNYLNNIAWIKSAQPDLLAQNIVTGKSIFGLNGNATRSTYTTGVCTKNVAVELGFRPKLVIVDGNLLQVYSEYDSSLNMDFINIQVVDLGLAIILYLLVIPVLPQLVLVVNLFVVKLIKHTRKVVKI